LFNADGGFEFSGFFIEFNGDFSEIAMASLPEALAGNTLPARRFFSIGALAQQTFGQCFGKKSFTQMGLSQNQLGMS
jgi:hypothetical protein